MNSALYDLPDDVLIYNFTFLAVPDILLLRQVRLSSLRSVGYSDYRPVNGSTRSPGYPSYGQTHSSLISSPMTTHMPSTTPISSIVGVTHTDSHTVGSQTLLHPRKSTRCLPDRLFPKSDSSREAKKNWLLTLSNEYSVLTIWDITHAHKCSEWSSKGAIFTEMAINADPESEASIAV